MALEGSQEAKLATVDTETDQLQELRWVGTKKTGVHNCSMDKAGNLWMATLGESIGMAPVPRPRHLAFWDRYFERRRLAARETP